MRFGYNTNWHAYMPGKRSCLNVGEKWSCHISWSHCYREKSRLGPSRSCVELSQVLGVELLKLAKGQKPSHRQWTMDLTSGWLGCDARSSSKWSTSIGVMILNRC